MNIIWWLAITLSFWIVKVVHFQIVKQEMTRIPIMDIQDATTDRLPAEESTSNKMRAAAIHGIHASQGAAEDLLQIIHQFSRPLNDWDRLKMVFSNTSPRTQEIMEMIEKYKMKPPKGAEFGFSQTVSTVSFSVNAEGDIVSLTLNDLPLMDDDIMDITKLPPKLTFLDLRRNLFTKWNVGAMPRFLEHLHLDQNLLKKVILEDAPDRLQNLGLSHNDIKYIDINPLKGIRAKRQFVDFYGNPNLSIDFAISGISAFTVDRVSQQGLQLQKEGNEILMFLPSVARSMHLNDWDRLKLVFNNNSPRTQEIMGLIEWCRRSPPKADEGDLFAASMFRVNEEGDIVSLTLDGLQLEDQDILDISKLPPKLTSLNLKGNHFTKWNVGEMPRHLEALSLDQNDLTRVTLEDTPDTLQYLGLKDNTIRYIDIKPLKGQPAGRTQLLSLVGNQSVWIDYSNTAFTKHKMADGSTKLQKGSRNIVIVT